MSRAGKRALAALVLAALALGAYAQNAGPRAVPGASNQGATSGGASSSANRGGAGGVPNSSPGALPGDFGSPGESPGPAGATTRRSDYLGGRATSTGVAAPASADPVGSGGSVAAPSCNDANVAAMSPSARLREPNIERIDLASDAAGANAGEPSNRYLMANLQEELAKPAPDLDLAAAYLGIAAGAPVTTEVVQRVTELLCVPLGAEHARSVSVAAEGQRGRGAARGR